MKIKIKKLNEKAIMPKKAHESDAGYDLVATSRVFDKHGAIVYGTGLAFEIPAGHVGLLFPRSSNAKKDLLLSNSVGVLDSGYRGEVMFKFKPSLVVVDACSIGKNENDCFGSDTTDWSTQDVTFHGRQDNYPDIPKGCKAFEPRMYEIGERIGQLIVIPIPKIEFEWAEELSDSERGEGGYGSTGK